MGRIRYQFDEHFDNAAAIALRSHGIDVTTAAEAGLRSATDSVVLVHAHASSRVIVTRDDDFLRLNAEGRPHSGIVFVGKGIKTMGDLIEMLRLVHDAFSAEEMLGHVEFV
jgi:predicted nuclease of predicted toxin-antitoxin system